MRPSLLTLIPTLLLGLSIETGLAATTGPLAFDAKSLVVDDFVGRLNVEVSDRTDIEVTLTGPDEKLADIKVFIEGDSVVVRRGMGPTDLSHGLELSKYPLLTVRVPDKTPIIIDDMDGEARIGDLHAPVTLYVASLDAIIGDVTSADIDRLGSGDILLGNVAGRLKAKLSGSGDIVAESAEEVMIDKRGSGDVVVGAVSGSFVAQMRGSGNIRVGSANTVEIRKRGSGDVQIGAIAGQLTYESAGIGNVDVEFVDGPVTVNSTSSGKIYIHAGSADPLTVAIAEYGDFTMDGLAVDPDLTLTGAAIVKLREYTGQFRVSGVGDVRVGGTRVYPLSRLSSERAPVSGRDD